MSISKLISSVSPLKMVLVLLACIALSSLAAVLSLGPRIERLAATAVDNYDAYFPEIRIRDGHASIREKQPHFVDLGDQTPVVIDTREGMQKEAAEYLKQHTHGIVLSRDAVILKNGGEIRIVSLKDAPDAIINAANLSDLADRYLPTVIRLAALFTVLFFLILKPLQVLVLALVPYFAVRFYKMVLSYGTSLKFSVAAMVPPVLLDALLSLGNIHVPAEFFLYIGLYVGLLIVLTADLIRNARESAAYQPPYVNP
ncbi:DUF1189 family protein [Desulfomonile tiedjei]|uniref:DUF1189 domain-containing protein n=1 Tax=Desulfomonile tiedjei (strain ATCC 49306 / DSM 6799 / DCB-1) TaxID=706587 RepID=I4C9T6_DESTA|nr:DUF1189 family protein [Desulfomonile tiedjei]AFM26327.1 Protein of unknown function (DUF1189) [Desulfomonile tiedjei DSM 6799]